MPGPAPESKTKEQIEQELNNCLVEYRKLLESKFAEAESQVKALEDKYNDIKKERSRIDAKWWAGSRESYSSSVNFISMGATAVSISMTGGSVGLTMVEQLSGLKKSGVWGAYFSPSGFTCETAAKKAHTAAIEYEKEVVESVKELTESCNRMLQNSANVLKVVSQ